MWESRLLLLFSSDSKPKVRAQFNTVVYQNDKVDRVGFEPKTLALNVNCCINYCQIRKFVQTRTVSVVFSPGCSPFENIDIIALRFAAISSGFIFITIDMDHWCPNGSASMP